jgi:DUF177 domain-containing protein
MLLDLRKLRGVEHVDRRYEPSAFGLAGEEFRLREQVHLVADLHKDARKVRLTGRLAATLEVPCGRCLEPFKVPVDAALDLMFLPAGTNAGDDDQINDDDLGVSFYEGEIIDLGELMREQFYLAVPMKPLCRDECKGLCPICGINRNREVCSCQTDWVDPRLEPLRKLRKG